MEWNASGEEHFWLDAQCYKLETEIHKHHMNASCQQKLLRETNIQLREDNERLQEKCDALKQRLTDALQDGSQARGKVLQLEELRDRFEAILSSDLGQKCSKLEDALAVASTRIAELEREKDELEIRLESLHESSTHDKENMQERKHNSVSSNFFWGAFQHR